MAIIKKLSVPLILLLTVSISLGMDETNNAAIVKERWPLLSQFEDQHKKVNAVSDLRNLLDKEWPAGEVMSFEHAQELVSKLPWHAEGFYIESKFELLSLDTQPETSDLISAKKRTQTFIELYNKAFMEDYLQRFPQQDKNNFDEAMLPFENYFKQINPHVIDTLDEERSKDDNEKAWTLLKNALKK